MGAWAIDLIVVYAIWMLLAIVIVIALVSASSSSGGTSSGSGGENESGVGIALFFLLFPLTPLYSALLHRYWRGQTLGKRAVRIAVVRPDGSALNLGQSLARSYVRLAFFFFFPIWILDSLWPLWQSERRSIHDHIANTMVVDPSRSQGASTELNLASVLYPLAAVVFLVVLFVTDWWEAWVAAGIVLSPLLIGRALRRRAAS